MKSIAALLLSVVIASPAPLAWAEAQPDGVKVGKVSPMAKLVPESYVEKMAAQQYQGLKTQAQQRGALVSQQDPQLVRLRRIANELIPHAKRWSDTTKDWQWEVNLISSNQVNAFCMPGGKIAFFTGILNNLKLTDDEVASVMGHEMAHALREHARERMAKSMALRLGAVATSSLLGLGETGQTVVGQGTQLMMLKFSRTDELEADVVGLDIAARAGYDPRAGIALWQKMAIVSRQSSLDWLSTHPAGENRIKEIRKHLPEVMPLYAKAKGKPLREVGAYKSNVTAVPPIE